MTLTYTQSITEAVNHCLLLEDARCIDTDFVELELCEEITKDMTHSSSFPKKTEPLLPTEKLVQSRKWERFVSPRRPQNFELNGLSHPLLLFVVTTKSMSENVRLNLPPRYILRVIVYSKLHPKNATLSSCTQLFIRS